VLLYEDAVFRQKRVILPHHALSAKRGIATVSRLSVRSSVTLMGISVSLRWSPNKHGDLHQGYNIPAFWMERMAIGVFQLLFLPQA